jgi:hypothetical protein
MVIFKPNVLLHIEDDLSVAEITGDCIMYNSRIEELYGRMKFIKPLIIGETVDEAVEQELGRIGKEMEGSSAYVNVATAQVARRFLGSYLPAALISDTCFPMNGKLVVEWIKSHGFPNYPLIGLSGTDFHDIDPKLQEWFGTSNAVYFSKGCTDPFEMLDKLVNQVAFNTEFNRRMYGNAEGEIAMPSGR